MNRQKSFRSWGTIVALFVLFAFRDVSFQTIAAIATLSFLVGLTVTAVAKRRRTGEAEGFHVDEFHGQFVAVLPIWFFDLQGNLKLLAIFMAFLLFIVCDEGKPWLMSKTEKRFAQSPFGVMVRNTVTGGMSAVILGIFIAVFHRA